MAERYIPEHRRTQFKAKNTFKPDELRRRREEQQVEIRRQKREENLAKRRGIARGDGAGPEVAFGGADSDDEVGLEVSFSNGRGFTNAREKETNTGEGLDRLHLRHLLQSVLQDAQTRLFFKAQAVVQSEIGHYVPRPTDLEYPEVLERLSGGEHGRVNVSCRC